MTFSKWVIRSLVHYRHMHLAVALAAATATAAMTGALAVGDSVKATLGYILDARLGTANWAVSARERFFSEGLGTRLNEAVGETAPVLQLRGIVAKGDGSVRINQVRILGVDDRFFSMSLAGKTPGGLANGSTLINEALAKALKLGKGQETEVVVRVDNPAALSRNLILTPVTDNTIAVRLKVSGVADDRHFGRFSLEANQQEPLNLFVPLAWLQRQLKRSGQANLLMIKGTAEGQSAGALKKALNSQWRLEDAEAVFKPARQQSLELRSSRVFLDQSLCNAALQAHPDALPLLTYFVNELRVGDAVTPYSMVTAGDRKGGFKDILPPDMKDDQIVINQWLADDLHAKVGDELTMNYYLPGGGRSLTDIKRSFRICRVIPVEGAAADPGLMPDFPGIKDAEKCSDWDPGLPINLHHIRDKDEAYWGKYRGTPKAFITLAAGQAMWANSYGSLTAIRFPSDSIKSGALEDELVQRIDPASLGLSAAPVREIGSGAIKGGTDLGRLFLGLSMFLFGAGILLNCLLFVFSIEGRRMQTGMLLAIGFPAHRVRRLYLMEGCLAALLGAVAGTGLGLVYTRMLIFCLSAVWQGAVAGTAVRYFASMQSLGVGFIVGFIIALLSMTWTLHRQMKESAYSLLSGSETDSAMHCAVRRRFGGWILSVALLIAAFLLIIAAQSLGSGAMAGAFFGAGALLLISVMTWIGMALHRLGYKMNRPLHSLPSLALRNSSRRWGRSMAVIGILACGVFMVVAVSANRKDLMLGAEKRTSGTGGFSFYAESSIPVIEDLNSDAGRRAFGLNALILDGTSFIEMRVRDGDDASCLNLNRAQEPRILGVNADRLAQRRAFAFRQVQQEDGQPWDLLRKDLGKGVIPAIGDYPTIFWGLGKKIGDDLIYRNQKGEEVHLRIVAIMESSILQGNLIISESAMERYFPEVEGYRAWMIDAPAHAQVKVSEHLTQRLADAGLSVEAAADRLMFFNSVENTYLSIFLVLGGLGLVLGCAGLGLVVVRNMLERQGELAMMRAVGFTRRSLLKMVCLEHASLLGTGLLAGMICALIAVAPALHSASGRMPSGLLAMLIVMIGLSGLIWVMIAACLALRGTILTPLRNE